MDDQLIDDALRGDTPPPPTPFFRLGMMRRLRASIATPPLAFPWRVVAVAVALGTGVALFIHPPVLEIAPLIGGSLVFAFVLRAVSDAV